MTTPDVVFCHNFDEYQNKVYELHEKGWHLEKQKSFSTDGIGRIPIYVAIFERQARGPLGRFRANEYVSVVWLKR